MGARMRRAATPRLRSSGGAPPERSPRAAGRRVAVPRAPREAAVRRRPQPARRARMSLFFKFRSASRSGAGGSASGMECGVAAAGAFPPRARPAPPLSPTERSPAKAGLHVNFSDKGEVKERREKFLTAKYGSHQMALIRKRLAVEMWLYDELQKLYEAPGAGAGAAGGGDAEVEVDIDELLDMDSDELRRRHLATLLADAKKPQKDVHKFINDLLEKAKTL